MQKKHAQAYRAVTKIAKKEGIPVDQVIRAIEEVILDAYSSAQKSNDQAAIDKWADIPCEGNLPMALELITYPGNKVHGERLS